MCQKVCHKTPSTNESAKVEKLFLAISIPFEWWFLRGNGNVAGDILWLKFSASIDCFCGQFLFITLEFSVKIQPFWFITSSLMIYCYQTYTTISPFPLPGIYSMLAEDWTEIYSNSCWWWSSKHVPFPFTDFSPKPIVEQLFGRNRRQDINEDASIPVKKSG